MLDADMKQRRRKNFATLGLLMLTTLALLVVVKPQPSVGLEELPKLQIVEKRELPIAEVSGMALRKTATNPRALYVIGDAKAEVAQMALGDRELSLEKVTDFSGPLLEAFSLCASGEAHGCRKSTKALLSQWEALTLDGAGRFLILKEEPAAVIILNRDLSELLGVIRLDFTTIAEDEKQKRAGNSLGEGFVLLKNGHIIVAKEKNPVLLIEFGPEGAAPVGLTGATLLQADATFPLAGARQKYVPLRTYGLRGPCDLSEMTTDEAGHIYLLSQECRKISRFSTWSLSEDPTLSEEWLLPQKIKRPEAFVVLSPKEFIVGSDARSLKKNSLFWVAPSHKN